MIKLSNHGWHIEWMKCPKCGLEVASKPNKENGYSQFRCTDLACDFEDNLTEIEKSSKEKMKQQFRLVKCLHCGKTKAVSKTDIKTLCYQCTRWFSIKWANQK